jgi:hypothetical protein
MLEVEGERNLAEDIIVNMSKHSVTVALASLSSPTILFKQ